MGIDAECRDHVRYVLRNLNPEDKKKIHSAVGPVDREILLRTVLHVARTGIGFLIFVDGEPAMVLAANPDPDTSWRWTALGFGTNKIKRCIPCAIRAVKYVMLPHIWKNGGLRVTSTSPETYVSAHQWLKRAGATPEAVIQNYGFENENFIQFMWLKPGEEKCVSQVQLAPSEEALTN